MAKRSTIALVVFALASSLAAGCNGGGPQLVGFPSPTGVTATMPIASTSASASSSASPGATATPVSAAGAQWIAAWADAPTAAGPGPVDEMSVREIVKPTVGSRGTVRLHFTNVFGATAVTLGAVHLGVQGKGAAVTGDVPVTFGGRKSVTLAAGADILSDSVTYAFPYGTLLAVTEYIEGANPTLTFHEQGFGKVTSFQTAQGAGDQTADATGAAFTGTTMNTYLLDRVDVFGNYKETVVAFGSSTTDGYQACSGCGVDEHMSWPEQLAALLHQSGHDDIGIANEGISGNTVADPGGTNVAIPANTVNGEPGFERFTRDVLGIPGAKVLIEYLGANDLRVLCDPMASEIVPDKQSFVQQAHAAGLRVVLGITAPSAFCNEETVGGVRFPQGFGEEAERFQLVAWERATSPIMVDSTLEQPPGADAIADFAAVLADPTNLSYMLPQYDSGDQVHPNDAGYAAMAKAIPLSAL